MNDKEKVRDHYNLPHYIQSCGVELKQKGKIHVGICPFHVENHGSFVVYEDGYKCFGCNASGDLFGFVERRFNLSFPEALSKLADEAGIVLTRTHNEPNKGYEKELLDCLALAQRTYHDYLFSDNKDAKEALAYLMNERGLLSEKGNDIFYNRILFPITDKQGNIRGFGGRGDNPKYLNSPASFLFNKSELLFGLPQALETIRKERKVTVVEGYMDAISAQQSGFTNTVAQLGTSLTELQLRLLANNATTITFALDNDHAGQSATQRAIQLATDTLQSGVSGRLGITLQVAVLNGKDPDEMLRTDKTGYAKSIEGALSVAEYLISISRAQLGVGVDETARIQKAQELLTILYATDNEGYRALYRQRVERAMGLPEGSLSKMVVNRTKTGQIQIKDKKHITPSFKRIEAQILATIIANYHGLQKLFAVEGKLLEMAWIEAIQSNDETLASDDDLLYGFYPLSPVDFQDSEYKELWRQFQKAQYEMSAVQSNETLTDLMSIPALDSEQLLVAIVGIRKRQCQLAIDSGQAGNWKSAKQRLTQGLAS